LLAVPTLMASENWDDHDRSNRYTTHLNAQAYLESCDPNAIMFTIGDNDTFPLWYMQEVEGIRRDLKLVNTSLFATDWYIDQMKRATYEAPPIPSQLTHDKYKTGSLDVAYHVPHPQFKDSIIDIKYLMDWIESDNEVTYYDTGDEKLKTYPTNRIRIPVNKENVLKSGIVAAKDADKIVDYIDITIDPRGLTKNRILMLDILANNDWKQPLYFTGGANADEEYIWLKDYLQLDGMAFKLVPIKTPLKTYNAEGKLIGEKTMFDMGRIDSEKMYNNIQKLNWRNINDGKIYIDEQTRKNSISMRNNLLRLAETFSKENNVAKAEEILDLSLEKMPIKEFGHYSISLGYPELYYAIGKKEKARKTAKTLMSVLNQKLLWFSNYDESYQYIIWQDVYSTIQMYIMVIDYISDNEPDNKEFLEKIKKEYSETVQLIRHLIPAE